MGILKAGETVFYRVNTCMFTLIWDLTEKELRGEVENISVLVAIGVAEGSKGRLGKLARLYSLSEGTWIKGSLSFCLRQMCGACGSLGGSLFRIGMAEMHSPFLPERFHRNAEREKTISDSYAESNSCL